MGSASNMQKFVEGEWNQFYFRQALPSDFEEVSSIVRNYFIPDEPMSILVGPDEEYLQDFDKLIRPVLAHNLSFLAVDKSTGQVAAARIIINQKKDMDWSVFELKSPKLDRVMKYLNFMDNQLRLFEKYRIEAYASLFIAVVHGAFRQKGLVTEMYRRAVALTRAEGFFLAKASFSSPYSRAAAATAGFTEVARITYSDVTDENGQPVIQGAKEDQVLTQAIYIL